MTAAGDDGVAKVIYLAKRNPALSIEAFPARWRQHSLLAGSMASIRPGFASVAQCVNLHDRTVVPRASLAYDGVNLLTLAHPDFASEMWQSDEVHELVLPDELETFSTYVRHFSLTTREHIASPGAMQGFCLILFLKRDRNLALDAFARTLIDIHGTVAAGARRAVVNLVTDRQPGYNFDAVTELWFASSDEARLFIEAPAYGGAYLARRHSICDEWRTVTMMTRVNYARPPLTVTPNLSPSGATP